MHAVNIEQTFAN